MDLFVQSAFSQPAFISSHQHLMTALSFTGTELLWQGNSYIQHLIIIPYEHQHPAREQGNISRPHSVPFVHRAHGLSPIILLHIYNSWRSSGFTLTMQPAPVKEHGGIGLFSSNVSPRLEFQWLDQVFIHHTSEMRPITIF